jgi:predicted nucleotidyltransferase
MMALNGTQWHAMARNGTQWHAMNYPLIFANSTVFLYSIGMTTDDNSGIFSRGLSRISTDNKIKYLPQPFHYSFFKQYPSMQLDSKPDESRIALEPRHLKKLLEIINRSMAGSHGTVLLFGSRARGNPRSTSDIDLAVSTSGPTDVLLSKFRENIENSTIPFTADIVDLGSSSSILSEEVQREGVIVWND